MFFGLMLGVLFSCQREETEPVLPAGTFSGATVLSSYDTTFIRMIVNGIEGIGTVTLAYNVVAERIIYLTTDPDGKVVPASGLLVMPTATGSFPMLSIQHGTIARRTDVSSQDPMLNEGVVALISGSGGYITLIPDYLGLGVSQEMHPYLMRDILAGNVTDMITAVREHLRRQGSSDDGQLYLAGYSEGGYVTLAAHRAIEMNGGPEGLQVVASAPMAGSYDLTLTVDTILSYGVYHSPAFIAYILYAYDHYYRWNRLDEIFCEPYASTIPGMFDGTHTTGDINGRLPVEIDQLLQADFMEAWETGQTPWLLEALRENSLLDWGPSAPVRLYHGDQDHTVPYWNAVKAREELSKQGGQHISLVSIAGGNHDSSVIPSFTGALHWFDSLRTVTAR